MSLTQLMMLPGNHQTFAHMPFAVWVFQACSISQLHCAAVARAA
jgi:hypothetical protein